ncbi:MAG: 30S ribosomal protein S6 [Treponema sp.]|nr:30S ribosomal protein S6 [Treponema sp.]
MRKYELMAVFPLDEEKSKKGSADVRTVLTQHGAQIESEEPFGDRDLTYEIQKQKRGRFILFTMKLDPSKVADISRQFKLNANLFKFLFVKLDEKEAK